jgi:cytochrome c-type biogenesis protein CcsB
MEKLAYYLFVSGFITTALAFLAFAAQALGVLREYGAVPVQATAGATVDGGSRGRSFDAPSLPFTRLGPMMGWLSVVILGLAIVTRAIAAGRGPFANMYDFSIAFSWGITFIYMLIHTRYDSRPLALVVLPIALGMMVYALSLPSAIDPLVPALQNDTLLTLHVSVAILAYSCFAVSFGAASLYVLQDARPMGRLPRLDVLDEMGFLSAALGFPFMTLVLILGAYWANTAWGRYWGWDPKETASLLTWLIYAGYLHTRALSAWRGRRSALLLLVGFVAVMLTYFGNYFFGGLHSYA